jgi:hypothetical protein
MQETEQRGFAQPDETREFPNGKAEIVKTGGGRSGVSSSSPDSAGRTT